jgi:hypothetical protein
MKDIELVALLYRCVHALLVKLLDFLIYPPPPSLSPLHPHLFVSKIVKINNRVQDFSILGNPLVEVELVDSYVGSVFTSATKIFIWPQRTAIMKVGAQA